MLRPRRLLRLRHKESSPPWQHRQPKCHTEYYAKLMEAISTIQSHKMFAKIAQEAPLVIKNEGDKNQKDKDMSGIQARRFKTLIKLAN